MTGKSVFKILAVASAIGLGGGYVWMNQKNAARKQAIEEPGRTMLPGSKSRAFPEKPGEIRTDSDPVLPPSGDVRTVLPGSKSAAFVIPGEEPEPPQDRTVLPGSKNPHRIVEPPSPDDDEP